MIESKIHSNHQYWPFPVDNQKEKSVEDTEKIKFLQNIYLDGFKAYQEMGQWDEYGAESVSRLGSIIRRGIRNRWELRLSEKAGGPELTAFVTEFRIAGTAVKSWLNGRSLIDILNDISKYLFVPSKKGTSYTLTIIEQYWPFPICEVERKRTETTEKIDFLETLFLEGFETYRVIQERVGYGAKSQSREGYIQEAVKRNHWELRLSEYSENQFMTSTTNFMISAKVVREWLKGHNLSEIDAVESIPL
jgi:hypothetical protein